jgi:hypothetical protein
MADMIWTALVLIFSTWALAHFTAETLTLLRSSRAARN